MAISFRSTASATQRFVPRYVHHESLDGPDAAKLYAASPDDDALQSEQNYMPDEVTRDRARRMHYAAHRARTCKSRRTAERWMARYYALRDSIVVGNRKLIFRAVRRRMATSNQADDLIGDCHIVLIHAVAAYNPWMGVRFSTYAYTCLVRALSRLARRLTNDWLTRAMSLDALPHGGPAETGEPIASAGMLTLDVFLRDDHPLLSQREKAIINRRFGLTEPSVAPTLERVGRDLGLSKERVRQVQAGALCKLRQALS